MSLAHYALLAAQEAAIAANVASGPTPLVKLLLDGNLTNGGSYGGSVTSNGTATYVTLGDGSKAASFGSGAFTNVIVEGSSATLLPARAEMTFMADVNVAPGAEGHIAGAYGCFSIYLTSAGKIYLYFKNSGGSYAAVTEAGSGGLNDGTWKTIKITYKSGSLKIYGGGYLLQEITDITGNSLSSEYGIYIGRDIFGAWQLTGAIDNVYLFDSVV